MTMLPASRQIISDNDLRCSGPAGRRVAKTVARRRSRQISRLIERRALLDNEPVGEEVAAFDRHNFPPVFPWPPRLPLPKPSPTMAQFVRRHRQRA